MNRIKSFLVLVFTCTTLIAAAQTVSVLFDATKAETAGNADWVIDADQHNLDWNPGAVVNGGNESNAQRTPTLAQSNINASTPETYWEGALSNWGIDCVKRGYQVETLPYNGQITYGSSSNAQDLSHYKVFIVCEPNIKFTTAEKSAILSFVRNGGGLFIVSDHTVSDRNGDGWDSPAIWNDLMSSNPFGITFNLDNFSETSTAISASANDSIIHGPAGNVAEVQWSGGTDMTLSTAANASVKGVVFRTGYLNNSSKVMFAYARYGSGKVAAIGDSSPCDDGTGDPNDGLYNGYTSDANGNHEKLLMNATIWLATTETPVTNPPVASFNLSANTICAGQSVNLTDNSTNSPNAWNWSMPGGSPSSSSAQNPTVTYATAGNYTVSLVATNGGGSSTQVSQNITVNSLPVVAADSQIICNGQQATLNATGANSYAWNTGASGSSLNVSPTVTTTYTVTGTDANNCTASADVMVAVENCNGVDEAAVQQRINIFPNPVTDKLYLYFERQPTAVMASIYTIAGYLVACNTIADNNNTIICSYLPNGMYMLKLTAAGMLLDKRLFIVQH